MAALLCSATHRLLKAAETFACPRDKADKANLLESPALICLHPLLIVSQYIEHACTVAIWHALGLHAKRHAWRPEQAPACAAAPFPTQMGV